MSKVPCALGSSSLSILSIISIVNVCQSHLGVSYFSSCMYFSSESLGSEGADERGAGRGQHQVRWLGKSEGGSQVVQMCSSRFAEN